MDFNHLYFHHQLATMRAGFAADGATRLGYQQVADGLGMRIASRQQQLGAAAACGWTALRAAAASSS